MAGTKQRTSIDWEAVEREYSLGIKSLKALGSEFGVSDAGIIKRARRDGWTRSLKAKIKNKADSLVSASLVSGEVSALTKVTERQVVEANAEAIKDVVLGHRRDSGRFRALTNSLLGELEAQTGDPELFAKLGEMMASPNDAGFDKLNEVYNKTISLPGRVDSLKKLSDALKTVIGLERQAFKMDEDTPDVSRLPEDLSNLSTAELREFAVKHSRKLFGAAFVMVEETTA